MSEAMNDVLNDNDIKLPPLPPLHIVPSVHPCDFPEVAQALMDYARAAIEALRKENQRLKDGALEDLKLRTSALEMMNAANSKAEALLDALRQIAEWPDGGNRYGQRNIKCFAQSVIDTAMREEAGNEKSCS